MNNSSCLQLLTCCACKGTLCFLGQALKTLVPASQGRPMASLRCHTGDAEGS